MASENLSLEFLVDRLLELQEENYNCECRVGGQDATSIDADYLSSLSRQVLSVLTHLPSSDKNVNEIMLENLIHRIGSITEKVVFDELDSDTAINKIRYLTPAKAEERLVSSRYVVPLPDGTLKPFDYLDVAKAYREMGGNGGNFTPLEPDAPPIYRMDLIEVAYPGDSYGLVKVETAQ